MASLPQIVSVEPILLKDHPQLTEIWVEHQIAQNPAMLRLGAVEVRERQRIHPKAGRLDLLLEDSENKRRYEVEIQLGRVDEQHIIRTIEYWDIERKLYPQYDHCAVIIAEDITTRFLNVINLFNGQIPLIAIQMQALKLPEGGISLFFTKVLDEVRLAPEEPSTPRITKQREDYDAQFPASVMKIVDELYAIIREQGYDYELKYNMYYIGLARDGIANNFVEFKPKQSGLKISFRSEQSDELEKELESAKIRMDSYDSKWSKYTIWLEPSTISQHKPLLAKVIKRAYANFGADE